MGTQLRHSGKQLAVFSGSKIVAAALVWLAWSNPGGLLAQSSFYTTASGRSTMFGFYDPQQAPVPKAPGTSLVLPGSQAAVPVVPPAQYNAFKAVTAPLVQSKFTLPPFLQITPTVIPRAPGAPAGPIGLSPTVSFEGIKQPPVQFQPGSPDVAVGPSDVVMVVNSSIAQFTKTGTLKKNTLFADFFASRLPSICPNGCLIFDPTIRYDQLHGHFLFLATARTNSLNQGYLLLSVSNGATYDSGWKTWVLDASMDGSTQTFNWADFWRVGFDNTAVYLAGNMYNSGFVFQYGKIRVLLKSDVYNLAATSLPFQDVIAPHNEDGSLADSITPVHQRGKPNAITSQVLVSATTIKVPATYLTLWKIVDPKATPLVVTRTTVNGLKSYNYPAPAPQLGGRTNCTALSPGTCLDSGDSRILKAVVRNGFLYTARDAGYTDVAGAATTVTYDIIDLATSTLVSQARLLNRNVFYPAFDVPATTPSGTQFASENLIVGTTTAPDGSLTYAGITNLKAGEDFYSFFGGNMVERWGDYFGGAVDPVSGGLWTSGAYAKPKFANTPPEFAGQWGTWAGYFPWTTTSVFTDVPSSNVFSDYINVLSLWQITAGCTATTFCPTDMVLRAQFGVFVIRSLFGNPCPGNTPCASGFTYTTTPYFTDVPANDVFFPYVQKLRDLGITAGCTATTFCPGDPVTRAQAAVFLVRGKMKALFGDTFTFPVGATFTDVPPTAFGFAHIQKMAELGITSGCTATQFCPDRTLTRQEAAVFVVRAFLN